MERFDLTALVKNYIQSAAILTKQHEITVRMEEYPPIYAWADEFKIEEVFMNFSPMRSIIVKMIRSSK